MEGRVALNFFVLSEAFGECGLKKFSPGDLTDRFAKTLAVVC